MVEKKVYTHMDFQAEWERLVTRAHKQGYNSLDPAEKVWFTVRCLVDAVNNGGFVSYFYNPGGELVYEALKALETIGALNTKSLLLKMVNLFPRWEVPAELDARNKIIETWDSEDMDKLMKQVDDNFFSQAEDVEALLIKFIIENGVVKPG